MNGENQGMLVAGGYLRRVDRSVRAFEETAGAGRGGASSPRDDFREASPFRVLTKYENGNFYRVENAVGGSYAGAVTGPGFRNLVAAKDWTQYFLSSGQKLYVKLSITQSASGIVYAISADTTDTTSALTVTTTNVVRSVTLAEIDEFGGILQRISNDIQLLPAAPPPGWNTSLNGGFFLPVANQTETIEVIENLSGWFPTTDILLDRSVYRVKIDADGKIGLEKVSTTSYTLTGTVDGQGRVVFNLAPNL